MTFCPCMAVEAPEGQTPSPDDVAPKSGSGSFTHNQIRQTARSIEDRIRRVLTPPGSAIASLRFLVVDDHPDAADALAAILELLGCCVRTCYDGWSATIAAAQFEPHVCLLDLKMPRMDGLELAARLTDISAGKPLLLIAVTALGDTGTKARALLSGFHHYMVKPVDVPTLIDAITQLWDVVNKQAGNTSPPPA
jgi:two-component system, OmpR family, response regulator